MAALALGLLVGDAQAAVFAGSRAVVGEVNFRAEIAAGLVTASVTTHEVGPGYVAHVGSYQEIHTATMRDEKAEVIALADDCVDVDATGSVLVARRHRHDRWPDEITPELVATLRRSP